MNGRSRLHSTCSPCVHFSLRFMHADGRNRLSTRFMPLAVSKQTAISPTAASSHDVLLKAGFVRQSMPGVYSMLPLGLRTLEKIEGIIDEEMEAIGSQKVSLPLLLGAENWRRTGRWDTSKGEFFRFKDRKESDMLLAPTHEEEITQLVAAELNSPKQLPIRLYQIGRKYRDEARPRAGLLRGREFIMKDLYTFDVSVHEALASYANVEVAYKKIFKRVGIPFVVAEADSGNIGGCKSHEYHLLSPVGEDTLLSCTNCGYTANEELAVSEMIAAAALATPAHGKITGDDTANQVCRKFGLSLERSPAVEVSVLEVTGLDRQDMAENQRHIAAVLVPKSRSVNLLKVHAALGKHFEGRHLTGNRASLNITTLSGEQIKSLHLDGMHLHVFTDESLQMGSAFGAIQPPAMVTLHTPEQFRIAEAGDLCGTCLSKHTLTSMRAIEVAHTFYLGTKYSSVLGCGFRANAGAEKTPAEMGCYGIGVSRLLAAVAEARHDDRGIAWPQSIAPYRACIVTTDDKDPTLQQTANTIYDMLTGKTGLLCKDVVIDDRKFGFGRKMTDAEMIGYPFIIVLGKKMVNDGLLEVNERVHAQSNIRTEVSLKDLESHLAQRFEYTQNA